MSLSSVTEAANVIDPSVPKGAWNKLSQDDRIDYLRLRMRFHQSQRSSGKDSRVASFHKELLQTRAYIERRPEQKEERCIVCGVCFAGKYICINTRLLKYFLGRCKSSINGSIQQMGYVALRTKTKARNCVLAVMHSLVEDVNNLRQWTVRCVSGSAMFAIVSSFPDAKTPEINDSDLTPPATNSNSNLNLPNSNSLLGNSNLNVTSNSITKLNQHQNKTTKVNNQNTSKFNDFSNNNTKLLFSNLPQLISLSISGSTVHPLPDFDDSNWDIASPEPPQCIEEWEIPSPENCFLMTEMPSISFNEDAILPMMDFF
ncbi:hypothetical protein TRFO_43047 [Tritrichomonas foetus]|uniref:Initiator binding domain-containing protein n=1 Tax=Tritrichomonas foetus TaxID=1144522 RepID=A0A1J4KXM7_9EUKA|nr:hypothetical protein TRFO_43047 [Tritrichomonas foetus]|eukprot:OHT14452.1 hypothetical protein TRFO_43047 [Tritrichomonas foetus]